MEYPGRNNRLIVVTAFICGLLVGGAFWGAIAPREAPQRIKDGSHRPSDDDAYGFALDRFWEQLPEFIVQDSTLFNSIVQARAVQSPSPDAGKLAKNAAFQSFQTPEEADQLKAFELEMMKQCDWNGLYIPDERQQKSAWENRQTLWHRVVAEEMASKLKGRIPL